MKHLCPSAAIKRDFLSFTYHVTEDKWLLTTTTYKVEPDQGFTCTVLKYCEKIRIRKKVQGKKL